MQKDLQKPVISDTSDLTGHTHTQKIISSFRKMRVTASQCPVQINRQESPANTFFALAIANADILLDLTERKNGYLLHLTPKWVT